MSEIIQIENLHKSFGSIKAVSGITMRINKGEMFGLVGPDGAGKTTTIRMLCGLSNQDLGKINILGRDLKNAKKFVQKKIGYLSQKFSLYGDLSVDENIEFFADIHNVKNYKPRRDELLEFTSLKNFRSRLAEKLSGGMKQKLALACSLIHEPEILFLDEPTTGVDPVSRRDFWKILSKLVNEGLTVFMSTPYLDEAERCTRVALMNKGKILALDTPAQIKKSLVADVAEFVSPTTRQASAVVRENTNFDVQIFGDRFSAIVNNYETDSKRIIDLLETRDIEITRTRRVMPTLENIFIHLIKEAN